MYIPVVFVYKEMQGNVSILKPLFLFIFHVQMEWNLILWANYVFFYKQTVITRTRMNRHLSIRLNEKLYIDIHRIDLFSLVIKTSYPSFISITSKIEVLDNLDW